MLETEKIRADFPILKRRIKGKRLVYLDNAATTQKPRQVIEAMVDFYENHNANVHRGIHRLSEEATGLMEEARQKAAEFIGAAGSEEIVFVRNASEAINLLVYSLGKKIERGDALVVSFLEHHSNFVGWQQLAGEKGAELRVTEIDRNGRIEINNKGGTEKKAVFQGGVKTGSLTELVDEKTKVVAVTLVSNALGSIVPIEEVVRVVRKQAPQAVVIVDGAQAVPHLPVAVGKMGVDFLVFSGHKMLGPTGIGVLWGRKKLLEKMAPFMYGGEMISEVSLEKSTWNKLPWKFEAGTPNIAGVVGLGAAIDYLKKIGMEKVKAHEQELTAYALEKLEGLERRGLVELYGERGMEQRSGIVTFNLKGVHAHDTAQVLDSEGVAVRSGFHCAMPLAKRLGLGATVRASFYIYNSIEEIEVLVKGINKAAKIFEVK